MRCEGSASTRHFHPAHKALIKQGSVSHALDKPPLQMCSGIASRSSEYEVYLGCGATAVLARAKLLGVAVAVIFMLRKLSACGLQLYEWLRLRTKPQKAPIWSLRRDSFIPVCGISLSDLSSRA